ncbi:MAG TPA: hypothetical protein VMU89_17905 [Thermomicrobiaceae bacterium]|nr:hypothetical protein [Thermomicrobiaceae bacterium]
MPEQPVAPPLYVWLDAEPGISEPDTLIEDTPGVPDIDLVLTAIVEGRFGPLLPSRIAVSPHAHPITGVRRIDVGRLLRERGIPHHQRFELLTPPGKVDVSSR